MFYWFYEYKMLRAWSFSSRINLCILSLSLLTNDFCYIVSIMFFLKGVCKLVWGS